MKNLITKGKFSFEGNLNEHINHLGNKNGVYFGFVSSDVNVWKEIELHSENKEELKANAQLIAEVFNITNECGFTPAELLKQLQLEKNTSEIIRRDLQKKKSQYDELLVQRNELLDTLKELERVANMPSDNLEKNKALNNAFKAINNANNKQ